MGLEHTFVSGSELIAQERWEQINKHGRTIEDDVKYNVDGQLAIAAKRLISGTDQVPKGWDIRIWSKMINKSYKERLVIAGSLIAAEIERISYEEKLKEKR